MFLMYSLREFTKYFFFMFVLGTVIGYPAEDAPFEENVMQTQESDASDERVHVSTTAEGVLTSMWRKITNFFSSDETTTLGPILPSNIQPLDPRGSVVPAVTWETHKRLRKRQKDAGEVLFDEGGVVAPFSNVRRSTRSFELAKELEEADPKLNEVRLIHRNKRSSASWKSVNSNNEEELQSTMKSSKGSQPIVEEFDQGDLENSRRKRFEDIPSNQWVTEKIVEGSDPVENIDNENFIEEMQEDPFLLQKPSFESIIVESEVREEQTIVSTIKELPGIQIFD